MCQPSAHASWQNLRTSADGPLAPLPEGACATLSPRPIRWMPRVGDQPIAPQGTDRRLWTFQMPCAHRTYPVPLCAHARAGCRAHPPHNRYPCPQSRSCVCGLCIRSPREEGSYIQQIRGAPFVGDTQEAVCSPDHVQRQRGVSRRPSRIGDEPLDTLSMMFLSLKGGCR
jgi:hypothetical protein